MLRLALLAAAAVVASGVPLVQCSAGLPAALPTGPVAYSDPAMEYLRDACAGAACRTLYALDVYADDAPSFARIVQATTTQTTLEAVWTEEVCDREPEELARRLHELRLVEDRAALPLCTVDTFTRVNDDGVLGCVCLPGLDCGYKPTTDYVVELGVVGFVGVGVAVGAYMMFAAASLELRALVGAE